MPNTISIEESAVNELLSTYAGIQLERAHASAGPFAVLVQLPYVADQTSYTYVDTSGVSTDWYRSARYTVPFSVGPYSASWPVALPSPGISLATLEQETARRVGPYYCFTTDASVPSTATGTAARFPSLQTTIPQDIVPGLYLLRRSASAEDRQRQAFEVDPGRGLVTIDRPWQVPPGPAEVCEFHHLDPAHELRPSVMAGLRRCFFVDRGVAQPGGSSSVDLTASTFWLTDPRQVLRVQSGWPGTLTDLPVRVTSQGGHVVLDMAGGGGYWIWITARRPSWSFVNGGDAPVGPTLDGDSLTVDLDYAASAAHIEAWHHFPARMQSAAAGGLQASQAMAAQEFTRQAWIWRAMTVDQVAFEQPFGWGLRGGAYAS